MACGEEKITEVECCKQMDARRSPFPMDLFLRSSAGKRWGCWADVRSLDVNPPGDRK